MTRNEKDVEMDVVSETCNGMPCTPVSDQQFNFGILPVKIYRARQEAAESRVHPLQAFSLLADPGSPILNKAFGRATERVMALGLLTSCNIL